MQGWIKDHRKELLSDIWLMPPLYHRVWQYLKYKVNHKPREYPTPEGKVFVDTGETVTSLRQIAEAVKWIEYGVERVPSPKTIRMILEWLEGEKMIARESNRKGTRIKVLNYSVYQGEDSGESNTKETVREQCLPTNKNVKNVKKKDRCPKTFSDDSLEMKMTQYMVKRILESYPGARIPKNLNPWALSFNRLMRLDHRTVDDIRAVMKWVYQDEFWCTNIRSPEKLREKWDTVYLQMRRKQNQDAGATEPTAPYHRRMGGAK